MIRIWDRYWNLLGSIEQPAEWPADCIQIDDAWRWQGAQHATIDHGGRRWDGRVMCFEGKTYARYVNQTEDCTE